MSKITNDGLTRFGTECFVVLVPMWRQCLKYIFDARIDNGSAFLMIRAYHTSQFGVRGRCHIYTGQSTRCTWFSYSVHVPLCKCIIYTTWALS